MKWGRARSRVLNTFGSQIIAMSWRTQMSGPWLSERKCNCLCLFSSIFIVWKLLLQLFPSVPFELQSYFLFFHIIPQGINHTEQYITFVKRRVGAYWRFEELWLVILFQLSQKYRTPTQKTHDISTSLFLSKEPNSFLERFGNEKFILYSKIWSQIKTAGSIGKFFRRILLTAVFTLSGFASVIRSHWSWTLFL